MINLPLEPLVTVVVPSRDAGPALRSLIAALEAQTLPRARFDVVIGDDGSGDGSTASLATEDGWIRVTRGPPLNAYAARNRAARLAGGEVLAFCDADCRPDATWLEAGLAALREAPLAAGLIHLSPPKQPTVWTLLTLDMCFDHESLVRRGLGLGGNLFVSRALFEQLGGFDDSLPSGGDGDLVARALAHGARPVFAAAAVVRHPTHDTASAFLRRIWFDSRWQSTRMTRAGVRPYVTRLRSWVPVVPKLRERRRAGKPLLLDRRRLASAAVVSRQRDDLKALPLVYFVVPYVAAAAQFWGWWRARLLSPASAPGPSARRYGQ